MRYSSEIVESNLWEFLDASTYARVRNQDSIVPAGIPLNVGMQMWFDDVQLQGIWL